MIISKLRFIVFISTLCAFTSLNAVAPQQIKHVSSLNLANIIFDNNRLSDVSDIMNYYEWSQGNDTLTWENGRGDQIHVIPDEDGRSLKRVELMTVDDKKLAERLSALQYLPASKEQKEAPIGYHSTTEEMYVSGHKCVAIMSQSAHTHIIFFRLTRHGYTRFGPEQ